MILCSVAASNFMKIVSVSHYYTPHIGGLEIVARMQAESLCADGHEVTVITCAGLGEKPGLEKGGKITVYRARALNIFDKLFSIPFPLVGFGFIFNTFKSIRNADVVHVHDVFYITSWIALLYAFCLRKPLVLTQHVAMVQHTNSVIMFVQRCVYAFFGRMIFKRAEKIIVYNPAVRNFLLSYNVRENKIVFIHNGIDTSLFAKKPSFDVVATRNRFNLPLDKKLVLFVGRLVPKKGYDVLFKAKDPSFELVYVGSGEIPESWLSQEHFHFLGALSQADLAMLYQAVDLFVFPAEGEMFTLVMQEAMASGLPIIATDEIGYKEYDIDRDLFVLCERKSEVFKDAIKRVLSDDGLMKEMSEYSQSLSQNYFDWNANFASVINLYKELDKTQK